MEAMVGRRERRNGWDGAVGRVGGDGKWRNGGAADEMRRGDEQ